MADQKVPQMAGAGAPEPHTIGDDGRYYCPSRNRWYRRVGDYQTGYNLRRYIVTHQPCCFGCRKRFQAGSR